MDISRCSISSSSYALGVVLGNEFDSVVVLARNESDGGRTELTAFALAFFGIATLKACFMSQDPLLMDLETPPSKEIRGFLNTLACSVRGSLSICMLQDWRYALISGRTLA